MLVEGGVPVVVRYVIEGESDIVAWIGFFTQAEGTCDPRTPARVLTCYIKGWPELQLVRSPVQEHLCMGYLGKEKEREQEV